MVYLVFGRKAKGDMAWYGMASWRCVVGGGRGDYSKFGRNWERGGLGIITIACFVTNKEFIKKDLIKFMLICFRGYVFK